ncbi:class I SAM-dependent methyltransferase [Azospirillum picis]|uniref:SAM-dependent methyltransferase n=1 Tax=Azospirillum picis TaxID=488438 RepID=A0ABU0MH61_9PROT|nr:class I SAM-dependent methyltransferase [Azospirillum picis]MBP2298995.1 SAM-dependent methyltransferase [Azospirillum picis]MDQ0532763.1 SAM-dependent methyltransferase [Azospirillum picis]
MNAIVPTPQLAVLRRQTDPRLEWLCAHIARNRFLPVPPPELHFIGDGDFRAIGAEFLRHFVRLGGLRPHHRVLEIGCGVGRMALPLTQYIECAYDGIDIVLDGIRWCADTITPAFPEFRFHHLDVANGLYNPGGRLEGGTVSLPFGTGTYDFVILTSVVTHLRIADTKRYAAEIGRLLKPGGRCFLSLFLADETARTGIAAGSARPAFKVGPDVELLADPDHPNAAVAYDEAFLLDLFAAHGLRPARQVAYGHWSGRREAENFQDLLVLEKGIGR